MKKLWELAIILVVIAIALSYISTVIQTSWPWLVGLGAAAGAAWLVYQRRRDW